MSGASFVGSICTTQPSDARLTPCSCAAHTGGFHGSSVEHGPQRALKLASGGSRALADPAEARPVPLRLVAVVPDELRVVRFPGHPLLVEAREALVELRPQPHGHRGVRGVSDELVAEGEGLLGLGLGSDQLLADELCEQRFEVYA